MRQLGKKALLVILGSKALDRRAISNAARVEADDVAALLQLARKTPEPRRKGLCARASRTTGIEEERTNTVRLVSGWMLDYGELNSASSRISVVDWYLGCGTLKTALVGISAGLPGKYRHPRGERTCRGGVARLSGC